MKVRVAENPNLKDDVFVDECMSKLIERYPQIQDYTFERLDSGMIQILMWGEIRS